MRKWRRNEVMDCFAIDIGMFSQPAALPDWNWFAIAIISSYVAKFRKIVWRFQIKQMFVGYAGLYSLGQVWPNVRKILTKGIWQNGYNKCNILMRIRSDLYFGRVSSAKLFKFKWFISWKKYSGRFVLYENTYQLVRTFIYSPGHRADLFNV